jgi:hypothetical protein
MAYRRVGNGQRQGCTSAIAVMIVMLLEPRALAFPPMLSSAGQLDFSYGSTVTVSGGQATAYKPESKLFYTADRRWWAVLGSAVEGAQGVFLYGLDSGHKWQRILQLPGADPWAKADTLLVGSTLYVALRDNRSVSGNPRRSELHRVTYSGGGAWGNPVGPTTITTASPETLTIARDSLGRLWTTYESSLHIRVGHTEPNGTTFTFADLPVPAVESDDIAAVTAFGSDADRRIGVFWSNQAAQRDFFAWRFDSDPISNSFWHIETAYGGGVGGCSSLCADDHANLKVSGDEVYVAVKTSKNDVASPKSTDPLIVLLRRSGAGSWSAYPVSTVADDATRPIVLLAPSLSNLWVFAAKGSGVYVWESAFGSPNFGSSPRVWTKGGSTTLANPTSTKQLITEDTGAVVETSSSSKAQYWHNEFLPQ